MLNDKHDVDMIFDSKELSEILCLQEACVLWGKSPRQVHYAIDRDQIVARKAITGGTWLITYDSLVEHWGQPERSINEWMV